MQASIHTSLKLQPNRPSGKGERGQGLVEYALGLTLVAMVASFALALAGPAIGEAYCQAVLTLNPNATCDAGGGPTILFAKYNPGKGELDLQARAPKDCSEDLIVKGHGIMVRQGSSYVFKKTISTGSPPATVEIGHDNCGWSTSPVN